MYKQELTSDCTIILLVDFRVIKSKLNVGNRVNLKKAARLDTVMTPRKFGKLLSGLIILCILPLLFAADEPVNIEVQQQNPAPALIDEITVLGSKSASTLRFEIRNAEVKIWGMLNDLIEEEEFKMDCGMQEKKGSYIKSYACEPVFLINARREAASQALLAAGDPEDYAFFDVLSDTVVEASELKVELTPKYEEYSAKIDALVAEHPELTDSILEMQRLVEEERRRKNSWWGNLFGRD